MIRSMPTKVVMFGLSGMLGPLAWTPVQFPHTKAVLYRPMITLCPKDFKGVSLMIFPRSIGKTTANRSTNSYRPISHDGLSHHLIELTLSHTLLRLAVGKLHLSYVKRGARWHRK
jgi:hypothetical protein